MKYESDVRYLVNFVPNIGSRNIGDYIIMEAVEDTLNKLFRGENVYIINISTHQPLSRHHRRLIKHLEKNKVKITKIVSGTNLFHLTYFPFANLNQWKVSILDMLLIKGVILFGVGTSPGFRVWGKTLANNYSKFFWSKILNTDFPHAVRDSESIQLLNSLGIGNAVNLGCPTLWKLTKKHCKKIPKKKSDTVVTSITDGKKDFEKDLKMLEILFEYYDEVYIWLQKPGDYLYMRRLSKKLGKQPHIIPPRLSEYNAFLSVNNVDYVGTRLHGGIKALQHKKRTIVVSIDNRAKSFSRDFNIPAIEREGINNLPELLLSKFSTKIQIPEKQIQTYLKSLKEYILASSSPKN